MIDRLIWIESYEGTMFSLSSSPKSLWLLSYKAYTVIYLQPSHSPTQPQKRDLDNILLTGSPSTAVSVLDYEGGVNP